MRQAEAGRADRSRRFYAQADVGPHEGGFQVRLDGRGVKTPAGAALSLPTEALARLVAQEWAAQGETLDLSSMAATRLAYTVIDRTAAAPQAIAAEVARYAGSDVLCYLAEAPQALVEAERRAWRPMLDWARDALGVELVEVMGVSPRPQPPQALARVEALVAELEPFAQAGVAYAAPLFGSAVLALAVQRGRLDAARALELSRVDEAFQAQRWGVDAEAATRAEGLAESAALLDRWFTALRA